MSKVGAEKFLGDHMPLQRSGERRHSKGLCGKTTAQSLTGFCNYSGHVDWLVLICDSDVEDVSWEIQSQDNEEEPAHTSSEAESEKDSSGEFVIQRL